MTENDKKNIYEHSKVYKLISPDEHYYIGSTTVSLSSRFSKHKCDARTQTNRKVYKYFNSINWEGVKIVLIKNFVLKTKEELTREEDNILRPCLNDANCLNDCVAFTGLGSRDNKEYDKKYRKQNHEYLLEYDRNRYKTEKRKEQMKIKNQKYNSMKVYCEFCKKEISKKHYKEHENTKIHIDHLKEKQGD